MKLSNGNGVLPSTTGKLAVSPQLWWWYDPTMLLSECQQVRSHGTFAESLMAKQLSWCLPLVFLEGNYPSPANPITHDWNSIFVCLEQVLLMGFVGNFHVSSMQQHLPRHAPKKKRCVWDLPRSRRTLAFQFFLVQKAVLTIALNKAPSSTGRGWIAASRKV